MDFDGPAPHPGPDGPGLAHGAAGDQKPPPPIELPPNNSIYINNISEKIKIQTLLTELQAIFEQFGNILEIHVSFSTFGICYYLLLGKKEFANARTGVYRLRGG